MSLPQGWRNHLFATGAAIREAVERMERIAVNGRSPLNHRLTRLAEDDWRILAEGLRRIEDEFARLLQEVSPADIDENNAVQPLHATRYHLSLALMALEQEVLADIDPDQQPKRGRLDPIDKRRLRESLDSMQSEVKKLREFMDGIS